MEQILSADFFDVEGGFPSKVRVTFVSGRKQMFTIPADIKRVCEQLQRQSAKGILA